MRFCLLVLLCANAQHAPHVEVPLPVLGMNALTMIFKVCNILVRIVFKNELKKLQDVDVHNLKHVVNGDNTEHIRSQHAVNPTTPQPVRTKASRVAQEKRKKKLEDEKLNNAYGQLRHKFYQLAV